MQQTKWIWMPHSAHLIVGSDCRFHLATYVGGYIVSTVGEYLPDSTVREIMADVRGIKLEGKGDERLRDYMKKIGFSELGIERKYETMVFRAMRRKEKCCPYVMKTPSELDFEGYNDAESAFKGHYKLCKKWGKKRM